ncbi:MAG: FecR domain-containing protein [Spirochaetales bacterium]|nr:FecR domain-containing protein [Spirochaetales bacterium]
MHNRLFAKICMVLIFFGISVIQAAADGEIVFLDGNVTVTRNGKEYDASSLYIGFEVGNYDFIQTGSNGRAELLLRTPQGQEVSVTVSNDSSFYIELSKLKSGKDVTSLEIVTGSLAVKVDTLASNAEVQARTRTTVMGVRGTKFKVDTTPNEDLLVTCEEGKVSCTDEDGKVLYSEPGQVVEKIPDESFKTANVNVNELEEYKKRWKKQRLEVFKANALRATRFFAKIFLESYQNIVDTYTELLQKKEIFDKWIQEDKQGKIGSKIEIMREKKQVIGLLFRLKRNLFRFERAFFRLMELEHYYKQGHGRGEIKPGLTAGQFFEEFGAKKKDIIAMIAKLKYLFKLFAKRNDGHFPVDMIDSSF